MSQRHNDVELPQHIQLESFLIAMSAFGTSTHEQRANVVAIMCICDHGREKTTCLILTRLCHIQADLTIQLGNRDVVPEMGGLKDFRISIIPTDSVRPSSRHIFHITECSIQSLSIEANDPATSCRNGDHEYNATYLRCSRQASPEAVFSKLRDSSVNVCVCDPQANLFANQDSGIAIDL